MANIIHWRCYRAGNTRRVQLACGAPNDGRPSTDELGAVTCRECQHEIDPDEDWGE